jgi:hypothetical protein
MLGKGYEVEISYWAELDIDDAASYYEKESSQLSSRFIVAVDAAIYSLPAFWAYELKAGGLRKIRAGRFPFFVYYSVNEKLGLITIEAVKHERIGKQPGL